VKPLAGRTALATGASGGIGGVIATAIPAKELRSRMGSAPVDSWLSVLLPRMQTTEEKGNRHDAQDRNT
jgi:hypothetical protein